MPFDNDKIANAARHNALADKKDFGQRESSRISQSDDSDGVYRVPTKGNDKTQLQAAVHSLLNKGALKLSVTANENEDELTSSFDVVAAIKKGQLPKTAAVEYVQKFQLIEASKMDDLTVNQAYNILVQDIAEEEMHNQVIASDNKNVTPNGWKNEGGEKVTLESQPKPDGKAGPKKQMPSTTVSTESTVNSSGMDEKQPKPDGSVSSSNWGHPSSNQSDVNKSKPEEAPKAKKVADVKSQMPSTETSTESDVNSAKPEEKQPEPKKAQMMPPPPMPPKAGPDADKGMDKDMDGDMDMPKPPKKDKSPLDGLGMGGGDKKEVVKELKDALDLLIDVTELLDGHNFNIKKKEKKEDGGAPAGEKKESPKEEKSEKPAEEKKEAPKESPFPKKKDEAPMPPVMAYKVELVKDEKSPLDSYYIASLGDAKAFSISLRQAFKNPEARLNDFCSKEYADTILFNLNKFGAKETFNNVLKSRGVILAQMDKLPENKFEEPAKPMNVGPEAAQDIANNDPKKASFIETFLEIAAPIIAAKEGSTAQEVVDEFRDTFSDETKAKQFEGRLSEKVERCKKDTNASETPDAYQKPEGAGNAPMNTPPPGQAATPAPQGGTPDLKSAAELKAYLKEFLPKVKAMAEENKALKAEKEELLAFKTARVAEDTLKARMTSTKQIAASKAQYGLIDEGDVDQEALRLAKLSDKEINAEVEIFKNSLRISQKLTKKDDSTNIEGNNVKNASKVMNVLPSQLDAENINTEAAPKFSWSKGFVGE